MATSISRLRRDLNLLLVNAARGFGNGWLLPAGPMRDRHDAIARADAVVIADDGQERAFCRWKDAGLRLLQSRPLLHARLEPRALVTAEPQSEDLTAPPRWREYPLELEGRRVIAVSGLADPSGFHAMLARFGAKVIATIAYPDHHDYGPYDVENILDAARQAEMVVTTAKDLVKLGILPADRPCTVRFEREPYDASGGR